MKETNYEIVKEAKRIWELNEKNIEFGILTPSLVNKLKDICSLSDKSDLELQNLRDFAVMYYGIITSKAREEGDMKKFDLIKDCSSALTFVIDYEIHSVRR
jgi:hypothetical protein